MPPKLTKKQMRKLDRERQEELKRIQGEEEEKRRILEEERRRVKDARRKAKEEQFAIDEKGRLQGEEAELTSFLLKLRTQTFSAEKEVLERVEWDRFLACSEKVDPNCETDITSLLSKYSDVQIEEKLAVTHIFKITQEVEDLNKELERLKLKSIIDNSRIKIEWCDQYIQEFRTITQSKIYSISAHYSNNCDLLLSKRIEEKKQIEASKYKGSGQMDPQMTKPEIMIINKSDDCKYGMWIFPFDKNGPRPKPIDFQELSIKVEVPRTLVAYKLMMRVLWTAYDYLSPKGWAPEIAIAGIVDVKCYQFVGQPDDFKEYSIKRVFSDKDALCEWQYPMPNANGVVDYSNTNPVRIYWVLPSYLYVNERDTIKAVLWDKEKCQWSNEHVDDVRYNWETKALTASVLELAPLALYMPRNVDYPYKSWKVRCVDNDMAILDVVGRRLNLTFEVTPGFVVLRNRTEPELAHIVDKPFEPSNLLFEMRRCGINLLPEDEDAAFCGMTLKDPEAEWKAIEDISTAVRAFYIEHSKWNHSAFKKGKFFTQIIIFRSDCHAYETKPRI
jgi:cancer susceptibility candidate protein 1